MTVILPQRVECSTFLVPISYRGTRVAKASKGPIPPPFLITIQYVFELMDTNIRSEQLKNLTFCEKLSQSNNFVGVCYN